MGNVSRKPKVAVIYKTLPQYRRRFFELLKEHLDERGIEFVLIYGQPGKKDASKRDTVDLPWAHKIENKIIKLGSRELYWQPCMNQIKDADLVIVEQASKLLINYYLFLANAIKMRKLAFWGHGRNFQWHTASKLGEALKTFVSRRVHWWFSYNQLSADVVKNFGFPEEKITIVQNAIDTKQLVEVSNTLEQSELERCRKELGIQSINTCVYAGGMYSEKRLDYLIEACIRVRKKVPDFNMIFLGAGVDEYIVKNAAKVHNWIHYVGPKFDTEKVPFFKISKLFLMPGLVGLAVLDTFALEVPIVTTNVPYHSPEIEYIRNNENGVIIDDPDNIELYSDKIIELLTDPEKLDKLKEGCHRTSHMYTVEEMAQRFANGVSQALR